MWSRKRIKKTKNKQKIINVVGGMENVILLGFCDVVMVWCKALRLGIVQDYSNRCIHLLL
jgi:hypothetical protein